MVSVDPYRNETTRHADVILPPPSALERSEYHLAFLSLAVRNYADWSPPLFPTDAPQEHEILGRLALIATGPDAGDDPAVLDAMLLDGALQAAIERPDSPVADRTVEELRRLVTADPVRTSVDHLVDVMIRTGHAGDWFGAVPDGLSLDVLAASPHGVDLGPLDTAASRRAAHRRRAPSSSPPHRCSPTSPGWRRRSARVRGRPLAGAHRPPTPTVEQLVDAQRRRPGQGPLPVHAAGAPRRRRPSTA